MGGLYINIQKKLKKTSLPVLFYLIPFDLLKSQTVSDNSVHTIDDILKKKICILTKINVDMKEKYKNILLQGWMFDCLDFMDNEEEQDKYFAALLRSALAGKVLTDNKKWEYSIAKALSSIEETRDNYYQKATKIGMKGKEYGILGKKYGKLGGRPRKGETKEQYKERKRLENEALISENKDIYALADEYAKERKEKATKEELKVWDYIKQLGLPNIYFQQPVFITDKNNKPYKFYIADFLDVDNKIDIEVDGEYHTTEEQQMKDKEREEDFKKMGYSTLRITNDEVNNGMSYYRLKIHYSMIKKQ